MQRGRGRCTRMSHECPVSHLPFLLSLEIRKRCFTQGTLLHPSVRQGSAFCPARQVPEVAKRSPFIKVSALSTAEPFIKGHYISVKALATLSLWCHHYFHTIRWFHWRLVKTTTPMSLTCQRMTNGRREVKLANQWGYYLPGKSQARQPRWSLDELAYSGLRQREGAPDSELIPE